MDFFWGSFVTIVSRLTSGSFARLTLEATLRKTENDSQMKKKRNAIASAAIFVSIVGIAKADPLLSSWYIEKSGSYARIYDSLEDMNSGTVSKTWTSQGQGSQELPAYAGVQEIAHSTDWVYIKTTGLGTHVMGPWFFDEAKTQDFGNRPANTASLYRFPREVTIPTTKTLTTPGSIGYFVDGIAMFDSTDTFSYDSSAGMDQTPVNSAQGDDVWVRDAFINEGVTFDNANAHHAGSVHHYHANPPALRHALGDSVDYDPATNVYTENFNGNHSPIIGWVRDGLPIYGPYGYSDPDPASNDSGIRRMISGFQLRDGSNGSTNLAETGRKSLPKWVNTVEGRSVTLAATEYGPDVNAEIEGETYILGRYFEDYAYKGDLGLSLGAEFDLNVYNVRFCRTPEFPEGTWAYFTCILPDGTPTFPYNIARSYFADPIGEGLTEITEEVEVSFEGGPAKTELIERIQADGDDIVISWSAVEGGSYRIDSTENLVDWDVSGSTFVADRDAFQSTDEGVLASLPERFYRLSRTGLANYDDTEFGSAAGMGPGGGGMGPPPGGGPPPR